MAPICSKTDRERSTNLASIFDLKPAKSSYFFIEWEKLPPAFVTRVNGFDIMPVGWRR